MSSSYDLCVNSLSSSTAGYYFCLIDRPLTDANYKSLFCLFSVQKWKLFETSKLKNATSCQSTESQWYYKYLRGTYNRQKKIKGFLISRLVAKNISPNTRNFLSLIALAFMHCTSVNIDIKKPHFRCKKSYAISARFICYESLVWQKKLTWILEKNLRNKLTTPLCGSRYYRFKQIGGNYLAVGGT